MNKTYPFQLEALPYEYDALEPYVDALTVQIHHGRHVQTYVDNLNKVLEGSKDHQSWSLEELVTKVMSYQIPLKMQFVTMVAVYITIIYTLQV